MVFSVCRKLQLNSPLVVRVQSKMRNQQRCDEHNDEEVGIKLQIFLRLAFLFR